MAELLPENSYAMASFLLVMTGPEITIILRTNAAKHNRSMCSKRKLQGCYAFVKA
jgi:hypothetical protein